MRREGDEDWRTRGLLFDRAAADYLDGRPGYPSQVFELLRDRCGLRPGASVLEVGPGAGQATMPLLDAGAQVTAVEPGSDLAEVLRARTAGRDITIVVDKFEDAELPVDSFDELVSATAFHWVSPAIGFPKAGRLLRVGGWLALWWTVWGDPTRHDPFHDSLQRLLTAKAPQLIPEGSAPAAHALDVAARTAEIAAAGVFGEAEQHLIRWVGRHTSTQARALFASFSPWLALGEPLRTELLSDVETLVREQFSDHIERPYLTVVYTAQRVTDRND